MLLNFLLISIATCYLGPGSGKWVKRTPESQGLDSRLIKQAARRLQEEVPVRYCFTIIKNGYMVWDQAFHNTTSSRYEADSAAKQFTALLFGKAVAEGRVALDRTLASYGVAPRAHWGPNNSFFANVTARHILGQTTGQGRYPPGTKFTYDSDSYLDHILYLLNATLAPETPLAFANRFAAELGLPDLYKWDEFGDFFSAGGGQMVSCNEMSRAGQLMLNKGLWPTDAGRPTRIISEEYMHQVLSPSFPEVDSSYGLLTWLNQEASAARCCAPTWGGKGCKGGNGYGLDSTILPPSAPLGTGIAMGFLAKYMYVIPEFDMVVTTFGQSWGSSAECNVTPEEGNYDDRFAMGKVWDILADVISGEGRVKEDDLVLDKKEKEMREKSRDDSREKTRDDSREKSRDDSREKTRAAGGSCSCGCSPDQGFGACANLPKNATGCGASTLYAKARDICPAVAIVRERDLATNPNCSSIYPSFSRKDAPTLKCQSIPDSPNCLCYNTRFDYCEYSQNPCEEDSPYFPIIEY